MPIEPDDSLRTHPSVARWLAEPRAYFLRERPERRLVVTEHTEAVLHRFSGGRRVSEVLPGADAGVLQALEGVVDAGLLERDDGPPAAVPVCATALAEIGVQWQVSSGARLAPSRLLEGLGLLHPLPPVARSIVAAGDALEHDAVCFPVSAPERQWNPYCGQWYLDLAYPGPGRSARWVQDQLDQATGALWHLVHEVVHAQVAWVSLLGVMGGMDAAGLERLHRAGEGIAYLVGDLELPIDAARDGYFERFWPRAAHMSHAHGVSPVAAVGAMGLGTPEARAEYVRTLYMEPEREPALLLPDRLPERLTAMAVVETELRYARFAADTVQGPWSEHYWESPELRAFREVFVPPAEVEVNGVLLSSIDDLWRHWRAITIDWTPPAPPQLRYLRARMGVQRAAMKVAELRRAVACPRLRVESSTRAALSACLEAEWSALTELFADLRAPDGVRDQDLTAELAARRAALRARLETEAGPVWRFTHPSLRGARLEPGDGLDRFAAGDEQPAVALRGALEHVASEARVFLRHAGPDEASVNACGEATAHLARLENPDVCARRAASTWLSQLVSGDGLALAYPVSWMETRTFVDPAVGFRYR